MNREKLITILIALSVIFNIPYTASADDSSINIALNQEAVASSYEPGHYAKHAIDGINDNEEYSYWKSADNDVSPWWQVDFGLDYKLSKVIIEARRGDVPESERKNFQIMVSNNADFSVFDSVANVEDAYENEYSANVTGTKRYRYLRIAKTDKEPLSLAEVKVMVDKSSIKQGEEAVVDAEEEETAYGRYDLLADISGTKYEKQITLLQNLGIVTGYTDGAFKPDNTITRAEFAAMVCNIVANGITEGGTSAFDDVSAEYWANKFIGYLYESGMVNGVSEKYFEPDSEITVQQAAKIIVSMLGKDIFAKDKGGYPNGYMQIARDEDILKNVTKHGDLPATRGEIAAMLYNSLDVRVSSLEVTGSGNKITDNDTLLYTYMRIKKKTDILATCGNVSINIETVSDNDGKISIGGEVYKTEIPNIGKYLGYNVDLYYSDEDADIAYAVVPRNTEEFVIESDDVIRMTNTEIIYEDAKRNKTIDMPEQYYVVYNNRAVRVYDLEKLKPSCGSVRLIDNNRDGKYEVVIIENYATHVVSGISTASSAVYLKNPYKTINYSADRVEFFYGKDRISTEPENLKEGMIASVMESSGDNKKFTIIVSDEVITGKVTAIKEEDGKLYITVNGTEYDALIKQNEVELNLNGTFYLDVFGRIAATGDAVALTERYGYINKANVNEDEDVLRFKIYTQYGDFITADSTKKLRIDGDKPISLDDAITKLKSAGNGEVNQVVRYKQNSNGEIISIDTVTQGSETDGLKLEKSSYSGMYANQMFNMSLAISDNTVMFVIPANKADSSQYAIKLRSELKASASYKFDAYDIDDYQTIGCCVFGEGDVDFNENASVILVDKVYTALNEDDELVKILCGYCNNEYVEFRESKTGVLDGLKRGDIISAALNLQGQIKQVLKRYYSEPDHPGSDRAVSKLRPSIGSVSSNTAWKYGTVLSKKDGKVIVDVGGDRFVFNTKGETRLRMYYYDASEKKVGLAGYGDIRDAESVGLAHASRVVVHPMYLETREVIILQ